ncbi:MAG: phosphoribosylformylglycinamidine synthase [Rikenellaceae bacterium]|nr:phosphoribosylformylglycinamidine synthase [Rikenellaceae bacterium]MCL2692257.1 phosphoribosylformylglycinamidine synthase [Rikenellaceae bacterium]
MILFFGRPSERIYAVETTQTLDNEAIGKLEWLFSGARLLDAKSMDGSFTGPRKEMVTPWSTNAVEITQTVGVEGITRIEEFIPADKKTEFDPMLGRLYDSLGQDIFAVDLQPEPIRHIEDIAAYNREESLAMSDDEVAYLERVAANMGRPLTDSEVFGFSQVNSEHCRHKIFNGEFVIDGERMPSTLFELIKKTTRTNPNHVVSAYKDNCALLEGPSGAQQWSPDAHDKPGTYRTRTFDSVITVKAETHNFPTTVEPFNGGATGGGGEIRDRIAGGKGAFPSAGAAVYMTAYPRLTEEGHEWERAMAARPWLYQTPQQILTKASNGASDFGNKFGQPLICGSLLTFEHEEGGRKYGYDKVIMQAGGIGYGRREDSIKGVPAQGDKIVMMGGDNYRIGMGGGAVSSVATGEYASAIELNAIQRSNPEMQRRVYNAIRAVCEEERNPIVSIHDHGAGGHLNCLSELVEAEGGHFDLDTLPVGDPTLSDREILSNESQERMGLVVGAEDIEHLQRIAERERAPLYVIGKVTGDKRLTFESARTGEKPVDWPLAAMFGSAPKTVMNDSTVKRTFAEPEYRPAAWREYLEKVLRLEGVGCKDWLTSKVDRSQGGLIAMQQTAGRVQLPVNDCAVVSLDFTGRGGIATSLGHAPAAALADAAKGSVLAIAEALTNIVFAPLAHGLKGVSLSANWMWPCRNEGEDARLYKAVKAASDFALALGINIPTGKDSLSMTQKYPDGEKVLSPGTVIITAVGETGDVRRAVTPALSEYGGDIVYIDMCRSNFGLGGSSFAQVVGAVGMEVPTVEDPAYFARAFGEVQRLIAQGCVLAGHDVSAGGLMTALLEMAFTDNRSGMDIDITLLGEADVVKALFSELPSLVLQVADGDAVVSELAAAGVQAYKIGAAGIDGKREFSLTHNGTTDHLDIDSLRDCWYEPSYLLDRYQSTQARERMENYARRELTFGFPPDFIGAQPQNNARGRVKAAVIREKGSHCEREMAWAMHMAGMDVRDVHMTDLISGRETLEDVNMIAFVGGFSNSDVLGPAKGWAGAFVYNEKARRALENFYARHDTLSLGVCNGCQLMMELGLLGDGHHPMAANTSGKLESAFLAVNVPTEGNSVMFKGLESADLGIWVAHGEGRFVLPQPESNYNVVMKYVGSEYPANPNGSDHDVAALASRDGRHVAMMPHIERAVYPWQWAYYPEDRRADEVTPWVRAFMNAAEWITRA